MARLRIAAFVASALLLTTLANAEPDHGSVFIKNATVVRNGQSKRASILIRAGLIDSIGQLDQPKDVTVLDGQNLVVYPGFVNAYCWLNHKDIKPAEDKRDERESKMKDRNSGPLIAMPKARRKGLRPSYVVAEHYKPPEKELEAQRQGGFTSALVAPRWGYFAGYSSLVQLGLGTRRQSVLKRRVCLHAGFFSGGGKGYPSTAMGVQSHIRQFLLDARHHRAMRLAFERSQGGVRRPLFDPDLQAMSPLLDHAADGPALFFTASKENEIRRALRLCDEFGMGLVLVDGAQGHRLRDELAERKVSVIARLDWPKEPTDPDAKKPKAKAPTAKPAARKGPWADSQSVAFPGFMNPAKTSKKTFGPELVADSSSKDLKAKDDIDIKALLKSLEDPKRVKREQHKRWLKQVRNVVRLRERGIPVAFSAEGINPKELLSRVQRLIKEGLPEADAVAALTHDAARILRVENYLGGIEQGRLANLTILSKPLSDKDAVVRFVVIDGHVFELDKAKKKQKKAGKKSKGAVLQLAGRWDIVIQDQIRGLLKFKQDGHKLTGSVRSPLGVADLTGKISGKSVEFTAITEISGRRMTIRARGTVDGDTITGTLDSPMGQDQRWKATRKNPGETSSWWHQPITRRGGRCCELVNGDDAGGRR